jgi:LacI family transcriptional regulator
VLAGLFDSAHNLNQHIRFFSFFDALKDPVFFNKNIHREEISSLLILLPSSILRDPEHEEILPRVIERVDNILCLETSIYDLPALIIDLEAAAQMVVEHLIDLGHRNIGFIALPDPERLSGYKRALMIHGLPSDENLIRKVDYVRILPSAYELTVELMTTNPAMTALFAANDESAIAAMAAIHDYGLRVPEDIAIVSIDNTDIASLVRPALTTINIPRHEMGEYALRFLLSQRDHPMTPSPSMILPIELIVRESSGAKLK